MGREILSLGHDISGDSRSDRLACLPAGTIPDDIKSELRRIVGTGVIRTLDPETISPEDMISRIHQIRPLAVLLDLAAPPHSTIIRAELADEYPILETTTELRPTGEPGGPAARHVLALGLRNAHGEIEVLPDGALDQRRSR